MAPPRNGNRFTSPVTVPAISTGKSSLDREKVTPTTELEHMPRSIAQRWTGTGPRENGARAMGSTRTSSRAEEPRSSRFLERRMRSESTLDRGPPRIRPTAHMDSTLPVSARVRPQDSMKNGPPHRPMKLK
jgi:hypothetical protein